MIECFNMSTAHLYGDALPAQFRLRHRIFIERENYDVADWRGMEYDQFDTPATQYMLWRDERGEAMGIARLAPTDRRYMLETLWPEMVTKCALPHSAKIWEGTRFGVDKSLPGDLRRRIVQELVLGYLEFSLAEGIEAIIGVMPKLIWRTVFQSNGWPVEYLGEPRLLGGDNCFAGLLPVSADILPKLREKCGLSHSIIRPLERARIRSAA